MPDTIRLSGFSQQSFAISSTGAQSAMLESGFYDVWADIDCYAKVGGTASNVTTSTGYLMLANNVTPLLVDAGEKIGAITSGTSGTLRYHRVG